MNLAQFKGACRGVDRRSEPHCKPKLKPGPGICFVQIFVCLCEGESGVSLKRHITRDLFWNASAELQAQSHTTPKPQLPKTISFLYKTGFC